jgi:hypothetical protein
VAMFGLGRFIRYVPLRTRTAFCNATFRRHGHKTDNGTITQQSRPHRLKLPPGSEVLRLAVASATGTTWSDGLYSTRPTGCATATDCFKKCALTGG